MIPLLALLATLGPGQLAPEPPADGFYRVAADGGLGEAVHYRIRSASVTSRDNLNTRFDAQFNTPLTGPPGDPDRCVLVVGGRRFEVRQAGSDQQGAFHAVSRDLGPDDAGTVARFFNVRPRLREHPGHRLATSFRSLQEFWKPGEKVALEMTITNVGPETVRFMVGGRNRGARDNQFAFSLHRGVEGVKDTGDPMNFGGLSQPRVLRPGETFRREIDLGLWFDTSPPGVYTGTGTYAVDFVSSEREMATVWQDVLAGEFYFQRSAR